MKTEWHHTSEAQEKGKKICVEQTRIRSSATLARSGVTGLTDDERAVRVLAALRHVVHRDAGQHEPYCRRTRETQNGKVSCYPSNSNMGAEMDI